MNGHPISPFDTRICGGESPINSPGFYELKTINYRLQERLMKEKPSQKKKMTPTIFCSGNLLISSLGTLGTQFFFVIFSTSKHFPGVPRDPRGSPGAQGIRKPRIKRSRSAWHTWGPQGGKNIRP